MKKMNMKYMILPLIVVGIMFISACTSEPLVIDDTDDNGKVVDDVDKINDDSVIDFQTCIAAGNPAMESYPRQCRHDDKTYTEEILEDGTGKPVACTMEYVPVCGSVEVQCIKAPCPPIESTFSNACEAEAAGAKIIYDGECKSEVNPKGSCLSFDGIWIEEANECEGMPAQMCDELGGVYNECASACRNDPLAQMCTEQCILVCDFS